MGDIKWEEFELNIDNGTELKLSDIVDDSKKMTEALIEAVHRAEVEAIRNNIKSNAILLNSEFNLTKSFYYSLGPNIKEVPPMVLGKSVYLDTDKILPSDTAFALFEANIDTETEAEKLKKLFKKYVKTDGKSLRFKNISYKRNKKDFERIMEIINGYDY